MILDKAPTHQLYKVDEDYKHSRNGKRQLRFSDLAMLFPMENNDGFQGVIYSVNMRILVLPTHMRPEDLALKIDELL